MENSPILKFAILRVPYFLEPEYDESQPYIESNRTRLLKKWGGKDGWEHQKQHHDLKGRGLSAGIPYFNLDRLASNTMASHRLIQYIGKRFGLHVSEAVYDQLNIYYFVDGHSLNDKPRLARVTTETVNSILNKQQQQQQQQHATTDDQEIVIEEEMLSFLNGNEGRVEIDNALRTLQKLGVHGIPKFIIEGTTIVDGAAGPETFVNVFREIEKRGSVRGPIFSDILGVSEDVWMKGSHTRESLCP